MSDTPDTQPPLSTDVADPAALQADPIAPKVARSMQTATDIVSVKPAHDDDDWGIELDREPEYLSNGRIKMTVAGVIFRLRRPRLGELEDLRELSLDSQDALAEVAQEAAEQGILKAPIPDLPDGATDEERDAHAEAKAAADAYMAAKVQEWVKANAFNRKHQASGRAQVAAFMAKAVELLNIDDHRLPDGFNDWPIWLAQAPLVTAFLQHWQFSDPEAPGSNTNGASPQGTSPGTIAV